VEGSGICILTDWVQGALSTGLKGLRSEAEHLSLFNAEIKKEWNYTFILPYALMLATRSYLLLLSAKTKGSLCLGIRNFA
jgi:hypothetical protein